MHPVVAGCTALPAGRGSTRYAGLAAGLADNAVGFLECSALAMAGVARIQVGDA